MTVLSLIISIAAFLLAGVGPAITAWITGHYRIKEKKLELEADEMCRRHDFVDLRRADTIAKYLTAAGAFCKCGFSTNLEDFGASMGEIYLFVDESLWPLIDKINASIYLHAEGQEATSLLLANLTKALSGQGGYYHKDPNRPDQ